jgi:predicted Zn-dependent peptidase
MEKIVLDNGLRILLAPMETALSASVEIWAAAGSRYEAPEQQGISHFVEHMLFKGTQRRTARQISEETDLLGGALNAYTTRHCTRFYAQVLADSGSAAPDGADAMLDILLDMVLHSEMAPEDTELERQVILDEMDMYEDMGEDLAHESLVASCWPDSGLGRPICGWKDTVRAITPEDLRRYVQEHYTPERLLVVLAGKFHRDRLLSRIEEQLGGLSRGTGVPTTGTPGFVQGISLKKKKFEQLSLELAYPGLPMGDPRRYAMMLLNFLVGGGASSRLFLRLREELGLAYSVYSSHEAAPGAGLFSVSASVAPSRQQEALAEIRRVLAGLRDGTDPIRPEEFLRARAQTKAAVILGRETVAAKAYYMGHNELFAGREIPEREVLDALDQVTLEQLQSLARDVFAAPCALSAAGGVLAPPKYEKILRDTGIFP